jgi:citrate synthase
LFYPEEQEKMTNITTEELKELESATSAEEWDGIVDRIKGSRSGEYPSDWYTKVKLPGMGHRVSSKFGQFDPRKNSHNRYEIGA